MREYIKPAICQEVVYACDSAIASGTGAMCYICTDSTTAAHSVTSNGEYGTTPGAQLVWLPCDAGVAGAPASCDPM